jgi:hypothetical protein
MIFTTKRIEVFVVVLRIETAKHSQVNRLFKDAFLLSKTLETSDKRSLLTLKIKYNHN